jgi:hypothetical protein
MGREAKEEDDGRLSILRHVFWSDLFLSKDSVWCVRYRRCCHSLQVSSYFLLGLVLFLALPTVITSSPHGRLEVFLGVESTVIVSRLFFGQMGIRIGYRSDPVRLVSRAAQSLALLLFNSLTISIFQPSGPSFKRQPQPIFWPPWPWMHDGTFAITSARLSWP